jgi:hypothetical protein
MPTISANINKCKPLSPGCTDNLLRAAISPTKMVSKVVYGRYFGRLSPEISGLRWSDPNTNSC